MKQQTELPLAKYIGTFFSSYLSAERGASPHTIRSYANAIASYLDYMETVKGIATERILTTSFNKENVLDFLSWIENKKGVSVQTRNQRLAAMHSFYLDTCYIQM